jgi:hypothetical protein
MAINPETAAFFTTLSDISDQIGWHNASPLTCSEPAADGTGREVTHVVNDEDNLAVAIRWEDGVEVSRAVYDFGTGDYLSWPSDATSRDEVQLTDCYGVPRDGTLDVMGRLASALASGQAVRIKQPSFLARAIRLGLERPELLA